MINIQSNVYQSLYFCFRMQEERPLSVTNSDIVTEFIKEEEDKPGGSNGLINHRTIDVRQKDNQSL